MKQGHAFFTGELKDLKAKSKIMGYQTFLAFMNGTRLTPLKIDYRTQLEMMLANVETKANGGHIG